MFLSLNSTCIPSMHVHIHIRRYISVKKLRKTNCYKLVCAMCMCTRMLQVHAIQRSEEDFGCCHGVAIAVTKHLRLSELGFLLLGRHHHLGISYKGKHFMGTGL